MPSAIYNWRMSTGQGGPRRKRHYLLAIAFVGAMACASPGRQPSDVAPPALDTLLPALLDSAGVPGLALALVSHGRIVWARGFGNRRQGQTEPIDTATVFEAASLGKPVFAYAVMKLCERHILDLDRPLTQYTSERFLDGDPRLDLITARHVLSHTSGFQNWRSDKEPLQIHFAPGEKFLYSGEGYSYLQSVVAHLTGQAFEPYMKANILRPFGMSSSGYVWNDDFAKHMARL